MLRPGFGILEGIPLFWAVAPVRDIDWGDEGCFGVGFDYGERWCGGWGGLVVLL